MDYDRYSINTEIKYQPLEIINIPSLIDECAKAWQNYSLCKVNDCVIRLGVINGEFHWHKHDTEDEFFYVIDGLLHIDLEDKSIDLKPGQGLMVPRSIVHRTRTTGRTSILMVEGSSVTPTGD
ncbi:MAG: cupin domain-containing protein [Candidatus Thorarchaeota archaeon]|nr:cupin domain-containing protein [Candidatus Thorarchaeota archaeon]